MLQYLLKHSAGGSQSIDPGHPAEDGNISSKGVHDVFKCKAVMMSNAPADSDSKNPLSFLTRFANDVQQCIARQTNWHEHSKPPASEDLNELIRTAYLASMRSDESRQVAFRLVVVDSPGHTTIPLREPQDFTVESLSKLAPTVMLGNRMLAVARLREKLQIVGFSEPAPVHDHTNEVMARSVSTRGLRLTVRAPGFLRITYGGISLDLRDDETVYPQALDEIAPVDRWLREAANSLHLAVDQCGFARAYLRDACRDVVQRISNARHGGCIAVVPPGMDATDTIQPKYRIDSPKLISALKGLTVTRPTTDDSVPVRPSLTKNLLDTFQFYRQEVEQVIDLVSSLAAVDGAVVITRDLWIKGFGAEIKARNESCEYVIEVINARAPERRERRSLKERGMRHRSAAYLCGAIPDAVVFVVSQDGHVTVFWSDAGEVYFQKATTTALWLDEE